MPDVSLPSRRDLGVMKICGVENTINISIAALGYKVNSKMSAVVVPAGGNSVENCGHCQASNEVNNQHGSM